MRPHFLQLASALAVLILTGAAGPETIQTDFAAREARTKALAASLAEGAADPRRDAARAAAAGQFELVWGVGMLGASPLGVICNAPSRNLDGRTPLAFAELMFSDTPGDCDEPTPACRFRSALETYGPAYNRAMVEQSSFPYRDVCRPADQRERRPSGEDPALYTQPARPISGPVHDVYEAVRRGSLEDVRRELKGVSVNAPDPFGLTPLAWAAIRNRTDVIRLLLDAGADPEGVQGTWGSRVSPLWFAAKLGRDDAMDLLLAASKPGPPLEIEAADLVLAATEAGDGRVLARVLKLPGRRGNLEAAFAVAQKSSNPQLADLLLASGAAGSATDLLAAAAQAGDLAAMKRALAAGADPNGTPSYNPPLGYVAFGEHDNDEELLELLLDAGADVERPVSHYAFSARNPPLVEAVRGAFRGPLTTEADRLQAERQQRLIVRLLEAGAKPVVNRAGEPPLSFFAVIGFNGRAPPSAKAAVQPLPMPLIRRLVDAGMDMNATYKGRTVLDWIEQANRQSPLIGQLRELGAREATGSPR